MTITRWVGKGGGVGGGVGMELRVGKRSCTCRDWGVGVDFDV